MIQALRIDNIAMSLNQYRNEHYHALTAAKKEFSEQVKLHVLEQGIQPVKGKVIMTYEFYYGDLKQRDPDNACITPKFTQDALVDCGILQNDRFSNIPEIRIRRGGVAKPAHVWVYLEEIDED